MDNANLTPVYVMTGVQDSLEVFNDKLEITPKGIFGFLNKGLMGTKSIPFASVSAIEFKKAGAVFSGHLRVTILGGGGVVNNRVGSGFLSSVRSIAKDENSFVFSDEKNNALAIQIK